MGNDREAAGNLARGEGGGIGASRITGRSRIAAFAVASALLHGAALAAIALFGARVALSPPPPDDAGMVLVFEPTEPPPPTPEVEQPPLVMTQAPPDVGPDIGPPVAPRLPVAPPVRQAMRPVVASPAPTPRVALPEPESTPTADASWQASVAAWLASHKQYPEDARRHGEEGRVAIRFTVDRSGQVLDAEIASSSGSARLDAATLALFQRATLPAFPASMPRDRITLTTAVRFSLR